MPGSWSSDDFPRLENFRYEITSAATRSYNCLAWAAAETNRRWEPDGMNINYWPEAVPREVTVEAFIAAYRTIGYEPCRTPELELGFEKIALYTDADRIPTHAARQLRNGNWTSKLGDHEDIEHPDLECLHGPCYGEIFTFMKRPIKI
jgi:hypothetical protein